MGYDDCVKGYRVYDPVRRDVTTSRDIVVINEDLKKAGTNSKKDLNL